MEIIIETKSIVLILVIAAAAIGAALFFSYRAREKAKRYIRDAFGKVPHFDHKELEHLTSYYEYSRIKSYELLIDDITWSDLNMDNVFQRINACSSSVGEEYLYYMLHELKTNLHDLTEREHLLQWIDEHPEERVTLQKILLGIGKRNYNGLTSFLFDAKAKKLKYGWIYIVMAVLPVVGIALMPFFAKSGLLLALSAVSVNAFVYSRMRMMLEGDLETMQYFSALLYGAKSIDRKLGSTIMSLGFNLTAALKPFRRTGGLVSGGTKQITSDLESFTLLCKAIFLVDLIFYNRTVNHLIRYTDELNQLYKIVGELDAGVSIASYRKSLELFCTPVFHEDNTILFLEAYHPLLKHPIPNSGNIGNDSIVTGSNASGKSTFIKTIAINSILAQTINTCCAQRYELSFSYVASSMALKDDILSGDSYFITEIKSLKRIIQYCKERRCVCFVDEILRGTNTPERIAASTAVLKLLHETDSLCLVASHDIELTKILEGIYDNYHFSEKFEKDTIEFDYLLKKGASRSTNAIRLLEHMGFDQRIVKEAQDMIKETQLRE